jgi:hypothetical protein
MDLKDYVQRIRNEEFSESPQLSLGELIEQFESLDLRYDEKEYKRVSFDFGSAVPTTLDSWRGSYCELALGYELSGYDRTDDKHFTENSADKFLEHLKDTVGVTLTGWKGGDFLMDESTPVWVANPGNSGTTAVVGVHDAGWQIIILTTYMEY